MGVNTGNASAHAAAPTAHDLPAMAEDAQARGTGWARLFQPLTAILAVQAAVSLSLIWSNTAFTDEADYLWLGRLLVAHWLHGSTWPSQYAQTVLSGSPLIYPPLGAIANAVAGIAGARILSLIFMLGATALLYSVANVLFDRMVATVAIALWVTTEPAIRLAFATYDPLTVLLNALSAWLIVQVTIRRHRGELIALAALALGVANATTYPDVVIDPAVLGFAFFVWRMRIGKREAWTYIAWMLPVATIGFVFVMTAGHSWQGIMTTVFSRSIADKQATLGVINQVWSDQGLVLALALAAVVFGYAGRKAVPGQFELLGLLGFAVLIVPIAQLHEQTATSLDKHLAFGLWFASMGAGYAVTTAARTLIPRRNKAAVAACAIALVYPLITGWQSAWLNFHGWSNSGSFVAAIEPVLASARGDYYIASGVHVAEYYSFQGDQWQRWSDTGIPKLTATGVPKATWAQSLRTTEYGVFALFYPAPVSPLDSAALLHSGGLSSPSGQSLVGLAKAITTEPGLPSLTEALEKDLAYKLVAIGPYDSRSIDQIYVIWEKV
jgi:Dolichyl-phosphate-mannose-protein mannosyltransferase